MDPKLIWHLNNNVFPPITSEEAVEGIGKAIEMSALGRGNEVSIEDAKGQPITYNDIVEDLKLELFVEEKVIVLEE